MRNTSETAYKKSNEITEVALKKFSKKEYAQLLGDSNRQKDAQALINYLCGKFHIPSIPVVVLNKPQPHATGNDGNLRRKTLGVYSSGFFGQRITMYNLTAVKQKEVAIKTFAGTLLHEFMHHYDMTYLKLGCSPHTAGFYKRISDLEKKLS